MDRSEEGRPIGVIVRIGELVTGIVEPIIRPFVIGRKPFEMGQNPAILLLNTSPKEAQVSAMYRAFEIDKFSSIIEKICTKIDSLNFLNHYS